MAVLETLAMIAVVAERSRCTRSVRGWVLAAVQLWGESIQPASALFEKVHGQCEGESGEAISSPRLWLCGCSMPPALGAGSPLPFPGRWERAGLRLFFSIAPAVVREVRVSLVLRLLSL